VRIADEHGMQVPTDLPGEFLRRFAA